MAVFPSWGRGEGAKYVYFWAVTNMLQENTSIFAASNPAAVVIGIHTDMKRGLVTENYRVQNLSIATKFQYINSL
jgi:hypothetical protein